MKEKKQTNSKEMQTESISRRKFVELSLLTLPAIGGLGLLLPTPACADEDDTNDPTPRHIEGPFYKSNAPERNALLEEGMKGTRLLLTGRVLSTHGKPIPRAILDFWQADAEGNYDNRGFRLRGHQFSDDQGLYSLLTVVPGRYFNRAPHIHVKVQPPNQRLLTTQLFFPDEPTNRTDPLYKDGLLMAIRDMKTGKEANFDFVLVIR